MVRERQWTLRTLVVLVIPPLSEVFEPQLQCHGSAHLNSWSGFEYRSPEEHFTPEIVQGLQQSNSLLVGSVFRKLDSAQGPWIPTWKSRTWGQKSFTPKTHGGNCRQDTHSTRHICAVQFDHTANRTLNALERDLLASLCHKTSLLIWCVTCLIHGCSLTRLPS